MPRQATTRHGETRLPPGLWVGYVVPVPRLYALVASYRQVRSIIFQVGYLIPRIPKIPKTALFRIHTLPAQYAEYAELRTGEAAR